MSRTHPIRLLIADDHNMVAEGLAAMLTGEGFKIVGYAATPDEAFTRFFEQKVDVALLDVRFGTERSGLDCARAILARDTRAKIVFVTQFEYDAIIREAYRIGAKALVTKDCKVAQLVEAIEAAHAGQEYYLPKIAERLVKMAIKGDSSPQAILDAREYTVFLYLAQGWSSNDIAEKLQLSNKTIHTIRETVRAKLKIDGLPDFIRLAMRYELLGS